MEVFIRFQVLDANSRKVVRATKQSAQLKHLWKCRQLTLKGLDRRSVVSSELKQEDDFKRAPHRGRVHVRVVATNDSLALKTLHSTQAWAGGQPDPRGQIDIIQTPFTLKDLNNCAI